MARLILGSYMVRYPLGGMMSSSIMKTRGAGRIILFRGGTPAMGVTRRNTLKAFSYSTRQS
jgi:hypothetical protein